MRLSTGIDYFSGRCIYHNNMKRISSQNAHFIVDLKPAAGTLSIRYYVIFKFLLNMFKFQHFKHVSLIIENIN